VERFNKKYPLNVLNNSFFLLVIVDDEMGVVEPLMLEGREGPRQLRLIEKKCRILLFY